TNRDIRITCGVGFVAGRSARFSDPTEVPVPVRALPQTHLSFSSKCRDARRSHRLLTRGAWRHLRERRRTPATRQDRPSLGSRPDLCPPPTVPSRSYAGSGGVGWFSTPFVD